eukprot:gene11214-15047_t
MSGAKKRKGLSVEDKRRVILGIYHDKKEPLNLKEIENLASRLGVVQQTVKEVNQSLIDDFMVQTDKIGAANFFWSFPSKSFNDQLQQKARLDSSTNQTAGSIHEMQNEILQAKQTRNNQQRQSKLTQLQTLKEEEVRLDKEIEIHKNNDPEEIAKIHVLQKSAMDSANRWTDNIFIVKKYLTKKAGMSGKDAGKLLGMDDSFDYLTAEDAIQVKKTKSR